MKSKWVFSFIFLILLCLAALPNLVYAEDPPPEPSKTSTVGEIVTNPVTGETTTVSGLIVDPVGTGTAGDTAFVQTLDGYVFLVKVVGETIYNKDTPPLAFDIVSLGLTPNTVLVDAEGAGDPAELATRQLDSELQTHFFGADEPGVETPPIDESGVNGVRKVLTGDGGSNGRDGALFVPPKSGGDGATGPTVNLTNNTVVSTTDRIGIEAGSIGGKGGNGGDSYLSFWSGRDGGDGGAGGTVNVTNNTGIQVATTGDGKHGIFAYSRSGAAGNGGSGFAAPGGGTGGHSSDGGSVTVTNNGNIITEGDGAYGIYGLSVSNNGGGGGSQWGIVGESGSGGYGGNGGPVSITNANSGTITTDGNLAHGILAQSIGGSGGSSGTSGNLLVSLNGSPDNGGNGGTVSVTNDGVITTNGLLSRGIFAQSIGGGGGSGGGAWGLIALGGSGSNGGSSDTVTVKNNSSGIITTEGHGSDGIFAQSVGGSGGSGSDAGGLVAVGGSGANAGDGGVVTVENLGTITTTGDYARGIVAQSIGGGGGDGGNTGGMVAVGGSGEGGGIGKMVTVKQGGEIRTEGSDASGIFAQSVGGGGGNGGSAGSVSAFVGVAVGGTGGAGGAGGDVNVTLQGQDVNTASVIQTRGDRSGGLFAQSVGGGGGNGGGAVQATIGFGGAVSVAVGGQGGNGGTGGLVEVSQGNNGESIVGTEGIDSPGVFVQSVGGGGGNGGYAVSAAVAGGPAAGALSVGVGGSAGDGGMGGKVNFGSFTDDSEAMKVSVLTTGDRSPGLIAQSVGGGGGNGGFSIAASASGAPIAAGAISIGVGGSGGEGGKGGAVDFGLDGDVRTEGETSTGILVQSVGGGGGNGGFNVSASVSGAGIASVAAGVGIGGSAGGGGLGDTVNSRVTGNVSTMGDNSGALVVQSVGGGGGNGGFNVTGTLNGSGTAGAGVSVGVGGSGGSGGAGGAVQSILVGDVGTAGQYSTGVTAQSLGGGGGNGGFSVSGSISGAGTASLAANVAVGGSGGTAGDGKSVTNSVTGNVDTAGLGSGGVLAQSVGGGGGNGGFAIGAGISGAGTASGTVSVGVGGSGGAGGSSAAVTNEVTGNVSTEGENATGVTAQSLGGGGGNGGFSIAGGISGAGTASAGINVGVGGSGGAAGNSSTVTNTVTGDITTTGKRSGGVLAQSVGGGGGNGGFAIGAGISGAGTASGTVSVGVGGSGGAGGSSAAVTNEVTGNVSTEGEFATGVTAQSLGGGGGNGGFAVTGGISGAGTGSASVNVSVGGSGGTGNTAGNVTNTVIGDVSTTGGMSGGVLAQSVGGGGGNGGFAIGAGISGAGTASGAIGVGVGGSGGSGGISGQVTNAVTGNVSTEGEFATGITAQSLGGGGGNGGFSVVGGISGAGTASASVNVSVGGSGGTGNNANTVMNTVNGNVMTSGLGSGGVLAQSVGGGGGNGGFTVAGGISGAKTASGTVSVGVGGSGGGGGMGSTVTNSVTGDVMTTGDHAAGITAQSIGGGGGNGAFNVSGGITAAQTGSAGISVGIGGAGGTASSAGAVTNTARGDVFTSGDHSGGIVVQSLGGGGGNGGFNVSGAISAAKTGSGAVAVGIGGKGGGGGSAFTATNTVDGYVQTSGSNSAGITTQSLGGGGGNGGLNISGTLTAAKTASGGIAVGVGGFGGDGGDGAGATSNVTGGVITAGDASPGILTQSLGGGGGNGGTNISAAVNLTKENGGTLGVGVGGFGGDGGDAGDVSSTVMTTALHNQIGTTGDDSSAVMAQSIGGGGGNGGVNVTGAVNLSGKSGAAIGVGVGGFGGGAGNAGNVVLDTTGNVVTRGNNSNGLVAQSIGGGGGNGGTNVTGSLAIIKPAGSDEGTTVAASIGVGGFGGEGGDAGDVDVDYSGTIVAQPRTLISPAVLDPVTGEVISPAVYSINETEGSHGLMAQSVGGGGGNGAVNVSAGISYAAGEADGHGLLVGVGGFGGDGGNAGNVDVDVTGNNSITSYGDGRSAILASSIGGGGGNGGLNVSGGIVSDSPLIVGIGGMGGNAGTAGNVRVDAATDLFAGAQDSDMNNSAGLMAQSIGGGGGNGGLNVSGGIALSKEKTVPSVTFGIGGFGGEGAISGNVDASHNGTITTSGGWTHGVFAQSIAGGGGNGALNISGQINFADSENSGGKTDLSIVAGLGGHGGQGADAGNVTVNSAGEITTAGDYSRGIFAQSIGGGGGTGGANVSGVFAKNSSPIVLGVGGFGSGGGDAGSVDVIRGSAGNSAGKITTDGVGAIGIEATSIGGGGGDAGMNFNIAVSKADNEASTGGGDGAERPKPQHDGVDDDVFANYDSVLDQLEDRAPADDEDSGDTNKSSAFAAQIAIGGAGGEAGNGGTVNVGNYSDIETKKGDSHGILAQSIGGGGGNAALNYTYRKQLGEAKTMGFNLAVGGAPGNGGTGGEVTVTHEGDILTGENRSYGVLAQSIGGGGGNVGVDEIKSNAKDEGGKIGITIGRIGGTGGSAGDVSLTSNGAVQTLGDTSYGLLAQSVGNGGGNSSSTSVSVGLHEKDDTPARAASVSVGLEGGYGGSAGDVTLNASGSVSTIGTDSHAIFAQSVGGGGGNAGDVSGTASTISLAIGGSGGTGGTGGDVTVKSSADVSTGNRNSIGILAQSIGGAGGTGSEVKTEGESDGGSSVSISVGGTGGTGMTAGVVSVDNSGMITTDGADSHGVLAQSIGGGGGNAGVIVNKITNKDATEATNLTLSVGGAGGDGALSGDVTVENTGSIETAQVRSMGIFAQSIGGGGGNANKVTTDTISSEGAGNKISVGIGGDGGTGGAAGDVTVSNLIANGGTAGRITTRADYSHGILAMSVGGGGGTGSTTITSNKSEGDVNSATTNSVAFSLGGSGGTGGTGGDVVVENDGRIETYGDKAHGIVAQSVGGGGGSGGVSTAGDLSMGGTSDQDPEARTSSIAIGGQGGSGNRSGDVTIDNTGSIEVNGNESYGIYAQSVGGGGGDGGMASNNSTNLITNPVAALEASALEMTIGNIGIGGTAGDGADSGDVVVNHTGSITSNGNDSYGIFAQSIGGGGGKVGTSITSPVWMAADLTLSAMMGGRDGATGTAGTVTVNTDGDIIMNGANSHAQFTQSVNGGGGDLEFFLDASKTAVGLGEGGIVLPADSSPLQDEAEITWIIDLGGQGSIDAIGSTIEAVHNGDISTSGDNSTGSQTQSIGGGGGNANSEIVVNDEADVYLVAALGGRDSSNSGGGYINQMRTGDVFTVGDRSQGVNVQSIGGGGGKLVADVRRVSDSAEGDSLATASSRTVLAEDAVEGQEPQAGGSTTIQLGSDAGDNNDGGDMDLTNIGDVSTDGDYSTGLVAQSIGAGGGESVITGFDIVNVSVGATGFSTGDGGNILLTNEGDITTTGTLSDGIVLQSIGGGGGLVLTDLDPSAINITRNTDNNGNGGDIDFDQTGDINLTGDRSIGVLAQSVGGGGGIVDRVFIDRAGGAGNAGAIDLYLDGNIIAAGSEGIGIFAQSRAAGNQGDISMILTADKNLSFGTDGTGAWFSGGASNSFVNQGTVEGIDGLLGWGIRGEEGNEAVSNEGTYRGNFDLGSGTNSFTNELEATFDSGPQLLLGDASNLLSQHGVMILGGPDNVERSILTGSFIQSATGETFAELDFDSPDPNRDGGLIDQLFATGTADLAGRIDVSLLNPQLVPVGSFSKTLITGAMGLTDSGLMLRTAPSVVITYDLVYPTGIDAVLDYNVDFSPDGMSDNLDAVGDYFNRIQAVGNSPAMADTVTKLLYDPDLPTYKNSLSQMSPEFYGELQAEVIRSSQRFSQIMAEGGEYRFTQNEHVAWFNLETEKTTHDAGGDFKEAKHYVDKRYAMGIEKAFTDAWIFGMGLAIENIDSNSYDGRWVSDGGSIHIGVYGKHNFGDSQLALTATYGWGDSDVERIGQVTDLFEAKSNRDLETFGAMLRASHQINGNRVYLRPVFDLGMTHLEADSAVETGAGAISLELDAYDETHVWIRPSLGMGVRHDLTDDVKFHMYADLGLRCYLSDPETEVVAGFTGAPAEADPMESYIDLDRSYGECAVGAQIMSRQNMSLGVEYSTIFDNRYTRDSWSLQLKVPF